MFYCPANLKCKNPHPTTAICSGPLCGLRLQVIDDFMAIHGAKWRAVTADSTEATAMLEPALVKYQVRAGSTMLLLRVTRKTTSQGNFGIVSAPAAMASNQSCMCSMPGFSLVYLGYVQDPHQADKLAKIQSDLDETKVVLHRTIESMLERGEKLDTLVGKSEDLSMASQMFYKQVDRCNTASRVSGSSTLCVMPERASTWRMCISDVLAEHRM